MESPGGKVPDVTRNSVQFGHGSFSLISSANDSPAVAVGQTYRSPPAAVHGSSAKSPAGAPEARASAAKHAMAKTVRIRIRRIKLPSTTAIDVLETTFLVPRPHAVARLTTNRARR
jgi:hypothetical protein